MKIISHFQASLTIEAPWDEIRPFKGGAFVTVTQLIKQRYSFQSVGQSGASQQVGILTPGFQNGQFEIEDEFVQINLLEFQPGAIVVSAATTEQASKFADDVLDFLHKTLDFRLPAAKRARQYTTTIVVDFGSSFLPLFGKLNDIAQLLNAKIKSEYGLTPFGARFATLTPDNQIPFDRQYVIERRAITPAGENWVFSQAPLDTDAHVELLNEIDKLLHG